MPSPAATGSLLAVASATTLAVVLCLACASDIRSRCIPNRLVAAAMVAGLAFPLAGASPLGHLGMALAGAATGLAIWLPFYSMRMLGAGDVKLFAVCAAWLGPHGALQAAGITALVGGVLALFMMLWASGPELTALRLSHALHDPMALRQSPPSSSPRVPYALAIAVGVIVTFWFPELL